MKQISATRKNQYSNLKSRLLHTNKYRKGKAGKFMRLKLSPDSYPGGIAIWGALPAVYNTSAAPDESGVHVHARMRASGRKSIDETYEAVEMSVSSGGLSEVFTVNGDDASRYNVATILGIQLTYLRCPTCGHIHSDSDYELVHSHTDHTCESCGESWSSPQACVSNPVMFLKECCKDTQQKREVKDPVDRVIDVTQDKFLGGVQIWGSNPAIVWTASKLEEGGLHFHAFKKYKDTPDADETYGRVTLDGINLDAEQARHIMAQRALPFLENSIVALNCPSCGLPHFDRFEMAVSPHTLHKCDYCQHEFQSSYSWGVVSNPIIELLEQLKQNRQDQDNL